MATKAVNFRLEDSLIAEARTVARVYNISLTDIIKESLAEYLSRKRNDPFYRLTANIEEVTDDENEELVNAIETLTADDLQIVRTEDLSVGK